MGAEREPIYSFDDNYRDRRNGDINIFGAGICHTSTDKSGD